MFDISSNQYYTISIVNDGAMEVSSDDSCRRNLVTRPFASPFDDSHVPSKMPRSRRPTTKM